MKLKTLALAATLTLPLIGGASAQGADQCRVTGSSPSPAYQDGQTQPQTCDLLGRLRTNSAASGGAVTNTEAAATIAVTNTFQSAIAANASRNGCLLQNTATHTMFVFFGAVASATLTNSWQVLPGQTISCNGPGVVLPTVVAITGTAGDTFVTGEQ